VVEADLGGNKETRRDAAEELDRQSLQGQERKEALLASEDRSGDRIRASAGNGEGARSATPAVGARSPQESRRVEQRPGEPGDSLAGTTQESAHEGKSLSTHAIREVVEEVRQLPAMQDQSVATRRARDLRLLLREASPSENGFRIASAIREIDEFLNRSQSLSSSEAEGSRRQTDESLRERAPKTLLQRQPEETGGQGSGRVQPGEQGERPSGAGEKASLEQPKEEVAAKEPSGWLTVGGPSDDWRSQVGGLSTEQNARKAEATTLEPSGTDAGIVQLNHNAYAIIHNDMGVGKVHWNGITLGKNTVQNIVDQLTRVAESSFDPSIRRPLASLAKQIIEASRATEGRLILLAGDVPPITLAEEKFHAWQVANRLFLSRPINDAVMQTPRAGAIAERLRQMGYPENSIPSEISAKAATGQLLDLGFIDMVRREVLDTYFDAITAAHGPDLLDKIPSPDKITQQAIARAKEKYAQVQEAKHRTGTPSETAIGRSDDTGDERGRSAGEDGKRGSKARDGDDTELTQAEKTTKEPKSSLGSTTYAGGFLDPELFKTLFPSVAEQFKQWVTDATTPGDEQSAMMRETRGEKDRLIARVAKKMQPMQRAWIFRSREDSKAFFNAVEEGRLEDLPEKDRALAQAFKGAFDQIKEDLQELKPEILQNYIENYFPHIWKHPSMAASTMRAVMSGRRPFAGKGSFLKQRTVPTIQDGLDMGLVPVSWNPVDLFLQKYSEMSQFLMAHKTLAMMKDAGTAKLVRVGQKAPDGWRQLDDKIGTVYGRDTTIDPEKVEDATYDKQYMGGKRPIPSVAREDLDAAMKEAMVIRGHYYAPTDAAKVFNNYVSRGLSGRSGIYDVLRWTNNNINSLQLGISAFHASTTSINVATSEVALGIEKLFQGKPLQAAGHMISGFTVAPSILRTMVNGSHMMQEYLSPGSYKKLAAEAEAVALAGGRAKMDMIQMKAFDKTVNAFRNGAIGEGLLSIPGTILQTTIAPVMDWMVPRMKLGAFYDMAHNIFDEASRKNWDEDQVRAKMQRAWDSIDNRFGQMVYENLFWHRALQDTLMLATRSVGWNFGDLRELGGAAKDTAQQAGKAAQGKMPEVTPRMAFAFALPLVTGLIGAVLTYLWTGKKPDTWKDYFYPKRQDGTRVSIPGYMKDVIGFKQHPVSTITNKQSPIFEMTSEAIQNRDFYGTEIRHQDDPTVKQFLEVAKWFGNQATPFSVSGTQKLLQKEGEDTSTFKGTLDAIRRHPGDVAMGQFGFQPAPAFVQHSDALNKAYEYAQQNRPSGTKTQQQTDHMNAMHTIEDMYRRKAVNKETIDAFKSQGKIKEQDLLRAKLDARTDPLTGALRSLTPEQALNVYQLATPEEKKTIRPLIEEKGRMLVREPDPEKRQQLKDAYHNALHGAPTRPIV
jgi:hypothetical protein